MKTSHTAMLLFLTLGVAACERTPPAGASTTPPPPAAVPAAVPATATAPVDHLSVNVVADKIAYQEAAARVDGSVLVSTGKAGFVMYGPYVALAPGRYNVAIQGSIAQLPAGTEVIFDVVSKGKVFGQQSVAVAHPEAGKIAGFQFELADAVADLEVRARVVDGVDLRIESYEVAKVN